MKRMVSLIIMTITAVLFAAGNNEEKKDDARMAPRLLNYQGFLTDTLGNPITNPSVSMTFSIYDAVSAGNQKWTETAASVGVDKGIFHILLGGVNPIPDSVFNAGTDRWLELSIGGQALSPRTRIVSVPYAYTATYSDTALYARRTIPDDDWAYRITDTADTTLQTVGCWGIARAGNTMYGNADSTHVNLGVGCATGANGQNYKYNTVGGGYNNTAVMSYSTVGGGVQNASSGQCATVAGGSTNIASAECATVAGGNVNTASNYNATVAGGQGNIASGYIATVGGGKVNRARGAYSVISGGGGPNEADSNSAIGSYSTIGGGHYNTAGGLNSTVGGGLDNTADGGLATVSGGYGNTAGGNRAVIGGGFQNTASGDDGFVGGGLLNVASGYTATISGGESNTASGFMSALAGGWWNAVLDSFAFIGSGHYNHNAGNYSAILAGYADTIFSTGDYSYLFGINSNLTQDSTFMVDMPHVWFGTEANGYEFPSGRGTNGQVMVTDGSGKLAWGSNTDNDWNFLVSDGADTTLQLGGAWGMTRPGNVAFGNADSTHVNFGVACTTGITGNDFKYNTIAGGLYNSAANRSTVGGGQYNGARGEMSTVAGGSYNIASGWTAAISGGDHNTASNQYAFVGGGQSNTASGERATVAGGYQNTAGGLRAFVGGGYLNSAPNQYAVVAGGTNNSTGGNYATVGGGSTNSAIYMGTVAGGFQNNASTNATIAGGVYNSASGLTSTVSGGYQNLAAGTVSAVGGGRYNKARGAYSVVSGGGNATEADSNSAIGDYSSIGGGLANIARGANAVIGGGNKNSANGNDATVGGGNFNIASGYRATIGGGNTNTASNSYTSIGGGSTNVASGWCATVGGGDAHSNAGDWSAILGGFADTIAAGANYSYLFGINSNLTQDSTFMVDLPHVWFGTEANGYELPYGRGTNGQALVTNGSGQVSWGSVGDNHWSYRITDTADTTLQMGGRWGIARFGNTLYGNADSTHVNLGVQSTTGTNGQNYKYITVSGGFQNMASGNYATVGGGYNNTASGDWYATVGGGYNNTASNDWATVDGGQSNTASGPNATVGGGGNNLASNNCATVGGGSTNTASNICATVGGGQYNTAADSFNFIGGGYLNRTAGKYSAILGGYADSIASTGAYSYLFGINSNLTQDSTFMVDLPHVWFGTEANGYEFPYGRGTNGQALVTNGSGQVSWASTNDNDWVINGSDMYSAVSGNVGIGVAAPAVKLDVAGSVKIADGTQALGRVFTSDASGLGSWQALPAAPVTSVFGRTGAVVAASGDYTTTLVTEGTNLYFTDVRAQAAITGGASSITSSNLTANRALLSDGSGKVAVSTVTNTELGYLSGVTSAIQTQLNGKQAVITGGASSITSSNLTANRTLLSDGSGKVAVSAVTNTELGYLSGVTSTIQAQLNGKAPTASPTFTGNVTMPGTGIWNSSGNVGIGTTSPSAKLDVAGTVKIADGTQALGRVFTSDASGLGSWQAIPNDNDWTFLVSDGADTTLQTGGRWGIARYGNTLYGNADSTHVNLGVQSTTGTNGQNYKYITVSGGRLNAATYEYATIGGGSYNTASLGHATIAGGYYNTVSGEFGSIGGGRLNTASGYMGTVGGGHFNKARGQYSVVNGGGNVTEADSNSAIGDFSVIGGGYHNVVTGNAAVIGGGQWNIASGLYSVVGGGGSNTAPNTYATVAGGVLNTASNDRATVGGGQQNTAAGYMSFVGGGQLNHADYMATVGGGWTNTASGNNATVSGGGSNTASGSFATIGGGRNNTAAESLSFIGGGNMNLTNDKYSAILGGYADTIFSGAAYSFLFGINSNLTQDSTFMVDLPHIRFGKESGGYEFPTTDGTNGQALVTNGSGQVSWGTPTDADWTISGSNMYSAVSGNVGIGTSSPAVRFEVRAGTSDTAAIFRGNLVIQSKATGNAVLELGEGLDYAEGFDVSQPEKIKAGTVLVIDPKNPGKLAVSRRAYDTKVAGIVAGGNGLASGVRLGTGDFDHNVALAGRVYCNVDASLAAIEPGDLLTTADTPGYAMKAQNYDRAKGAVLGKAMEPLAKGQKGQILVLVSLQ